MRYKQYTLADLKESASRKRFNVVSFFAGGGGSSCGYKLAGGDVLCVNEFQEIHAKSYSANFPDTPVIVDDIRNVTGKTIREKIGDVEVDILDGSPPCPPFSMAGSKQEGWGKEKVAYGWKQKNIEDLTFDQIRIVGDLKPKVVVCENVKGLTMDYAREYLTRMISEFEKEGYITDYQVLNGWQYGVPQKRERIFIVSIREDVADKIGINFLNFKSMVFPLPSDENKPTIRDAIEDLQDDPENMKEAKVLETAMLNSSKGHWVHGFETHPDFPGSGPCKGLRGVESREKVISVGDNVVGPWFEEQIKNGVIKKEDEKHSYYMSRVVPYDQAAHSLTEKGLQSKFMGGNHFHPEELRIYTLKEAQRIMTLPDDYKHEGSLDDSQARIGLMVAPMCMYHLAESIYQNVLEPYGKN
jgi:DNA (cytosine-5)-methyltransferase 1